MKNNRGFSIIEIVVSMAVGMIVIGAVASPIMQLMNLTHSSRSKIQTSMIETTLLHTLLDEEKLEKFIDVGSDPQLMKCLGGVGTSCLSFESKGEVALDLNKAMKQQTYEGVSAGCTQLSQECPIEKSITYKVLCATDQACSGVAINLSVKLHEVLAGKSVKILAAKTASKYLGAHKLYKRPKVKLSSCDGGVITGVDLNTGDVTCRAKAQAIDCNGKSVVGLGESHCGKSTKTAGNDLCAISFNPENFDAVTGSFGGVHLKYVIVGEKSRSFSYSCNASVEPPAPEVRVIASVDSEPEKFDREAFLQKKWVQSFTSFLDSSLSWLFGRDSQKKNEIYNSIVERQIENAERRFYEEQANNPPEEKPPEVTVSQQASLQGYNSENLVDVLNFQSTGSNRGSINILESIYNGGSVEIACGGAGLDANNQPVSKCSANFKMVLDKGRYVTRSPGATPMAPGVPWAGSTEDKIGQNAVTVGGKSNVEIVGNGSGFSTKVK